MVHIRRRDSTIFSPQSDTSPSCKTMNTGAVSCVGCLCLPLQLSSIPNYTAPRQRRRGVRNSPTRLRFLYTQRRPGRESNRSQREPKSYPLRVTKSFLFDALIVCHAWQTAHRGSILRAVSVPPKTVTDFLTTVPVSCWTSA